jgi:uncharacterized protein with HEPN domain
MRLESRKLLTDALQAVVAIEEFTKSRDFSALASDKLLRSAIYWQFAILGEAMAQLRKLDEPTFDRISESWRIVGFRNQIIHGYQVIHDNVTWQIIQDKLPVLHRELDQLLGGNP